MPEFRVLSGSSRSWGHSRLRASPNCKPGVQKQERDVREGCGTSGKVNRLLDRRENGLEVAFSRRRRIRGIRLISFHSWASRNNRRKVANSRLTEPEESGSLRRDFTLARACTYSPIAASSIASITREVSRSLASRFFSFADRIRLFSALRLDCLLNSWHELFQVTPEISEVLI
jgi:hypothetical protein